MKVYYIDENNLCSGEGESYTVPENATTLKPEEGQVWSGTEWIDKVLTAEELVQLEEDNIKTAKLAALRGLKVTTSNGNTFDAYDEARANMNEAIVASDILGITETDWKLADNSVVKVDMEELKEALALGIRDKGNIILGKEV